LAVSPDEAQLATAVPGVAVGDGAGGELAGALVVAGALGEAAGLAGAVVELELHAAANSVVPSSAAMPSGRPCRRGTDRPMMVSSLSLRQVRRLL
jgi:hypothetical protein